MANMIDKIVNSVKSNKPKETVNKTYAYDRKEIEQFIKNCKNLKLKISHVLNGFVSEFNSNVKKKEESGE